MQTQMLSINSTYHASDHILNMHAQYGTLIWQNRKPFWRQCKSLPAKYAVRTGIWTMSLRACWVIWIYSNIARKEVTIKGYSMMYHFVHGDSYIPEDVLLHLLSNSDTHYFFVPYARTNGYYYSFFPQMLRFWISLPPGLL